MRGRKPTPTQLRILRNNPGKRAFNVDEPQPPVVETPVPPPTVKGEALEEWKRQAPKLVAVGLLTEVDLPAFIAYCKAWGRYVKAEEKIETLGEVVKAPSGYPIQNPYLAVSNKALQKCQQFWGEFGMTPSARSRVSVRKGAPQKASKVAQFMARVK